MTDISNLRDTIIPKSDQLNADDLVGTTMTITVTSVSRGNTESPLIINYTNDGGRPFKPCKTMRKLLIAAWGENGNDWAGRSMQLFCDDKVKWAGKEVGGIRISHLSHITKRMKLNLTATRGKKQQYEINILQANMYDESTFNQAFPSMEKMIQSGKMTVGQVISKCSQTGTLSADQLNRINSIIDVQPVGFNPAITQDQPQEQVISTKPQSTDQDVQNNF